jgi:membrane protein
MAEERRHMRVRAQSWWRTIRWTVHRYREAGLGDWAAALTYYSVLSIFPALIALVSILGVLGQGSIRPLIDHVNQLAPGAATDIVRGALHDIASSSSGAGIGLVLGIAGALFSASGYVGGFTRASNAIYEVREGRPFWRLRPLQIVLTTVLILLLAACAIAVVLTGPLARHVGDVVGAGHSAVTIWGIAKWPAILLVVVTMIAVLYYVAPNVRQPKFRWITPGGVLAVTLWIAASVAFAFYVANFGSYNATYGSIAGVIVFLVWLWITNTAILLGAVLNAELERGREIAAGLAPEETIALPPREHAGADVPPWERESSPTSG